MPLIASVKGNGTNAFTTGAIDTTGADLLIATWSDVLAGSPPTISDSKGNTWTQAVRYNPVGGATSNIYFVWNPTSVGSGHTFTLTGTSQFASLEVMAWSGSQTSSTPLDVTNNNLAFGSTTLQPGSVTPSVAGELVVTHINFGTQGADATIDSGFAAAYGDLGSGGVYVGGQVSYLVQSVAAAVNPQWTVGSSTNLYATVATFKAGTGFSGGGAGPKVGSTRLTMGLGQ